MCISNVSLISGCRVRQRSGGSHRRLRPRVLSLHGDDPLRVAIWMRRCFLALRSEGYDDESFPEPRCPLVNLETESEADEGEEKRQAAAQRAADLRSVMEAEDEVPPAAAESQGGGGGGVRRLSPRAAVVKETAVVVRRLSNRTVVASSMCLASAWSLRASARRI